MPILTKKVFVRDTSTPRFLFSTIVGIILFAVGLLLCITIIGFLPGYLIILLANKFICTNRVCPECGYQMDVVNRISSTQCKKCGTIYEIAWI